MKNCCALSLLSLVLLFPLTIMAEEVYHCTDQEGTSTVVHFVESLPPGDWSCESAEEGEILESSLRSRDEGNRGNGDHHGNPHKHPLTLERVEQEAQRGHSHGVTIFKNDEEKKDLVRLCGWDAGGIHCRRERIRIMEIVASQT